VVIVAVRRGSGVTQASDAAVPRARDIPRASDAEHRSAA